MRWVAQSFIAAACLAWPVHASQETASVYQGAAAENFLAKSRITNVRPLGTGITRPMRVTLELDGVTRSAVFKSIDESKAGITKLGDGSLEVDFQDSWQTEIAAYRLDRMIGLGMVPATVERRVNGPIGSLQWWVESMMPEAQRIKEDIKPPDPDAWNKLMLKARLFDQLIANVDRHMNNLLVTKEFDIRLIDHSRSFRPLRELRTPEDLTRFSRSLLDAIAKLERRSLSKELGRYLSSGQIERMLQRRDAILALAKQRIAEQGEAAVIYP
jgi:hypothetical protein